MTLTTVKALTFDTGGTILDWHTGFSRALKNTGTKYGMEKDWGHLANELRRRSLKIVLNQGKQEIPEHTFDDAHRIALDQILTEQGLSHTTEEERREIWWDAAHHFKAWPDFPPILPKLRRRFICASFTILSYRIIIDTARENGLSWDAVISCEGIGKYKVLPEAYQTAAHYLQLEPDECCMIACHNFDLDAAKAVGFKTAFVRRPTEWGIESPPDPTPNPHHDIIVDDFTDLANALGVS